MLKLRRKTGETVRVGDAIITIEQLRGSQVMLAIEAPQDVRIVRGELEQKERAA